MPRVCIIPKANKKNRYMVESSAEAKICLECPLPVNECNPLNCKRYMEEKQKIKAEEKR